MNASNNAMPESPFAKYAGILALGNKEIDCYVSDAGQRLISMRATVKAIADVEAGNLGEYIGVSALKPYIDAGSALGELVVLNL